MINITFDLTQAIDPQIDAFKTLKSFLASEGIPLIPQNTPRVFRSAVPSNNGNPGPIERWYIQERKLTRMKVMDNTISREEFAKKMCEKHGIIIPEAMVEESRQWDENLNSVDPSMGTDDDDSDDENPML